MVKTRLAKRLSKGAGRGGENVSREAGDTAGKGARAPRLGNQNWPCSQMAP